MRNRHNKGLVRAWSRKRPTGFRRPERVSVRARQRAYLLTMARILRDEIAHAIAQAE